MAKFPVESAAGKPCGLCGLMELFDMYIKLPSEGNSLGRCGTMPLSA